MEICYEQKKRSTDGSELIPSVCQGKLNLFGSRVAERRENIPI